MADLSHERWVALRIAQRRYLVEQRRCPNVRIISKPLTHIRLERLERIRLGRHPFARDPFTQQIHPDSLSVSSQMAGNGRDRPPPLFQSMNFHALLLYQHKGQGSSPKLPMFSNQQLGQGALPDNGYLAPGGGEFQ